MNTHFKAALRIASWPDGTTLVRTIEVRRSFQSHKPWRFRLYQPDGTWISEMVCNDIGGMYQGTLEDDLVIERTQDEWSLVARLPFVMMPRLRARGLLASALCETILDRHVPTVNPSFNAAAFPRIVGEPDPSDSAWRIADRILEQETESTVAQALRDFLSSYVGNYDAHVEVRPTEDLGPIPMRVEEMPFISLRFMMAGISNTSVAGCNYVAIGGLRRPEWSVYSVARYLPDGPWKPAIAHAEELARHPVLSEAMLASGLVLADDPAHRVAWLDRALEHWPEPTWAPGLREAVTPGRLLGVDPMLMHGQAFLDWVTAAGLLEALSVDPDVASEHAP